MQKCIRMSNKSKWIQRFYALFWSDSWGCHIHSSTMTFDGIQLYVLTYVIYMICKKPLHELSIAAFSQNRLRVVNKGASEFLKRI